MDRNKLGQFANGHNLTFKSGKFVKCNFCQKEFYRKKSELTKNIFCSSMCYWRSLKNKRGHRWNRIRLSCLFCNKIFFRPKSLIKNKTFCSIECSRKFMIGKPSPNKGKKILNSSREKHWNWKGGRQKQNGYILIHARTHPFCDNHGYIREHRFVCEKYLGRYLKPTEDVHHVDKNTSNNNIKNLMVFISRSAHRRFECTGKIIPKEIIFDGRKF